MYSFHKQDKIFASDLYGRLQWRADRRAIVNVHTDLPLIFYLLLKLFPKRVGRIPNSYFLVATDCKQSFCSPLSRGICWNSRKETYIACFKIFLRWSYTPRSWLPSDTVPVRSITPAAERGPRLRYIRIFKLDADGKRWSLYESFHWRISKNI